MNEKLEHAKDILQSILQFLGAVSVPIFTYLTTIWKAREKKHQEALSEKDELIIHYNAAAEISEAFSDLQTINELNIAVNELFTETTADSFLILMAANGVAQYNVISVLYEREKDETAPLFAVANYKNLSIDDEYRKILYETEKYGPYRFITEKEKEGLLKNIYIRENTVEAMIYFICRLKISKSNDVMLYVTVSSKDNSFSVMDRTIITMAIESRIKPALKKVVKYQETHF